MFLLLALRKKARRKNDEPFPISNNTGLASHDYFCLELHHHHTFAS